MKTTLAATLALFSFLGACSTTPPAPAAAPATAAAPVAPAPAPAPVATKPAPNAQAEAEALAARMRQQVADLNAKHVYFDFDDYTVKPANDAMLREQAEFMKAHVGDRLTLQGNSDERGGSEYNLALGQTRADAVRKALVLLGATGDRIETMSYGKEKPVAACHDESCWSQNRRMDVVHAVRP
jgi:peptidoglycan-associated lipoprotein